MHGAADPNTQSAVRAAGQDCSFGKISSKNKTSLRSVPQGGHSSLPFCHHLFATPRFCAPVCERQAESPSMGGPDPVSSTPDCASVRSRFTKSAGGAPAAGRRMQLPLGVAFLVPQSQKCILQHLGHRQSHHAEILHNAESLVCEKKQNHCPANVAFSAEKRVEARRDEDAQ